MGHTSKPVLGVAAALLFAACATAVQAQQTSAAERAARERMANDAAESEEREMMLALTERYHRSGEQRDPRLAFAQIREDFVRIQVINNDLARAVSGGGQLDFNPGRDHRSRSRAYSDDGRQLRQRTHALAESAPFGKQSRSRDRLFLALHNNPSQIHECLGGQNWESHMFDRRL